MAGTGHPYEIANIGEVREFCDDLAGKMSHSGDEIRKWFISRKMVKFLTGERFVTRAPSDLEALSEICDPAELPFLLPKAADGNVRVFSAHMLPMLGIDLDHVGDWFNMLRASNSKLLSKIDRITVEEAVSQSVKWLAAARSKLPATRGEEALYLDNGDGTVWMRLLDTDALKAESEAMDHCVGLGGYDSRLLQGWGQFLSLRNEEGKSLATAHFSGLPDDPSSNNPETTLQEMRGYSNSSIPSPYQQHCADLMNALGASSADSRMHFGICRNQNGVWAPLFKVWDRITWNGFEGYAAGQEMILVSPRRPTETLCRLRKETESSETATIYPLDPRHYHIDEKRALARIADLVKIPAERLPSGLVKTENGVMPVEDTWEKRIIAGIQCSVIPQGKYDLIVVSHSSDLARRLLECAPSRHFDSKYGTTLMAASPASLERWNKTEGERCLAVLNGLDIYSFRTDDNARRHLDRSGIRKLANGQWVAFESICSVQGALTLEDGEWKFCDHLAVLRHSHTSVEFHMKEPGIVSQMSAFWNGASSFAEAAAFMNMKDWVPARRVSGLIGSQGLDKEGCWQVAGLVFRHGKWLAVNSLDEVVRVGLQKGKGRRKLVFEACEAETFIPKFPADKVDDRTDEVLAAALAAWLKSALAHRNTDHVLEMSNAVFGSGRGWHDSWAGRMNVCRRLLHLMDAKALKSLSRLVPHLGREMLKYYKYTGPLAPDLDRLRDFLCDFHGHMGDTLFKRMLKRSLKGYVTLVTYKTPMQPPRSEWFGAILERAKEHRLAYLLVDAACNTSSAIEGKEADMSTDSAKAWLSCFRTACLASWRFGAERGAPTLLRLINAAARKGVRQDPAWATLSDEAEALLGPLIKKGSDLQMAA